MIWFWVFVVIVAQIGALATGACAHHQAGLWNPDKAKRNRLVAISIVLSVVALLTAYRIGVAVAGC